MQTDPIADMLTRIRNATRAKHQRVDVPASKLKIEVARLLKEEGYISSYKLVEDPETKARKALRMMLKYTPNRRSVISGLKRISKPGCRVYRQASQRFRLAVSSCILCPWQIATFLGSTGPRSRSRTCTNRRMICITGSPSPIRRGSKPSSSHA